MKKKVKKIMQSLLCLLLILSCSFSNTIYAAETESTNSEGEWFIKLNWGDPDENIPDDYVFTLDKETVKVIKYQVTVEYRGDGSKTFNPGQVYVKVPDLGLAFGSANVERDISAEEKGSGSGRGDWYYSRSGNNYMFSNKEEISGSYTSTFQLMYTYSYSSSSKLPLGRLFNYGASKSIVAQIIINGVTKDSNTLNISWEGVQEKYIIDLQKPVKLEWGNTILSKIPQNEWNNYMYLKVPLEMDYAETGMSSYYLKDGYHIDLDIPDGVIIGDVGSNSNYYYNYELLYRNDKKTLSNCYNNQKGIRGKTCYIPLAIPRSMLDKVTIDIKADLYGTYVNESDEKLLYSDTQSILLADFDIEYTGDLYSVNKESPSYEQGYFLYKEVMEYGYNQPKLVGNSQRWDLKGSAIYYGKKYDLTIGDDRRYFIFNDRTCRKVEDDEFVVGSVAIQNPFSSGTKVNYELYARKAGTAEYEMIQDGIFSVSSFGVNIGDDKNRYCDVYIVFKDLESTVANKTLLCVYSKIYTDVNKNNGKEINTVLNLDYIQVALHEEDGSKSLIDMEFDFRTNIDRLDVYVKDYYYEVHNAKALLGQYSKSISNIKYLGQLDYNIPRLTLNGDKLIGNYRYAPYVSDYSMLGYSVNKYEMDIINPSYLDTNLDSLKLYCVIPREEDSTIQDMEFLSVEKFESKYNAKVTISEKVNADGNKVLSFKAEFDELIPSTTLQYVGISADCSISMDDYRLLKLGGKTFKTQVIGYFNNNIYNEVSDMYYSIGQRTGNFTVTIPNFSYSSAQGISKSVKTSGGYEKSTQKTNFNKDYSYKLAINSGTTRTANIIMYDNIENHADSVWKGNFNGVSFNTLKASGVDTSKFKVYYSSNNNQSRNLSSSGWVLSTDWSQSLADVKSIAVDMQDYVLESDSVGYIEVLMKAPSGGVEAGSLTKNQYFISYKEYDASDDTLSNPLKTTTDLPSNIVSVSLGKLNELTITKTIKKSDIWWEHGNPIFIFKIEGNGITKYVSVEFTKDEVSKMTGNNAVKNVTLTLPEGDYTVTEVSVMRWTLKSVSSNNAKTLLENGVVIDLSENASVAFTNECSFYNGYSHNAIVVNKIQTQ